MVSQSPTISCELFPDLRDCVMARGKRSEQCQPLRLAAYDVLDTVRLAEAGKTEALTI